MAAEALIELGRLPQGGDRAEGYRLGMDLGFILFLAIFVGVWLAVEGYLLYQGWRVRRIAQRIRAELARTGGFVIFKVRTGGLIKRDVQ